MFSNCLSNRSNKKIKVVNAEVVLYPPSPDFFPAQEGPLCYYYSLLRMMQYQDKHYISAIPECCGLISKEISRLSSEEMAPDTIDIIFAKHLTDTIVQRLDLPWGDKEEEKEKEKEEEEDQIGTVEDFMGEYSHSQAMALLLGMRLVSTKFQGMPIEKLGFYLKKFGPMVFDGQFSLVIDPGRLPQETLIDHAVFAVRDEFNQEAHAILVVGCQQAPQETVIYIDPNYPDKLLTMPFSTFQARVVDTGNGLICHAHNQLTPIVMQQSTSVAIRAISVSTLAALPLTALPLTALPLTATIPAPSSLISPPTLFSFSTHGKKRKTVNDEQVVNKENEPTISVSGVNGLY